jgi:hypothetical protein
MRGFNGWAIGLVIVGIILTSPIIAFVAVVAVDGAVILAGGYLLYLFIKFAIWRPLHKLYARKSAEKQIARLQIEHPERFMTDRQVLTMVRNQIREYPHPPGYK